MALPPLTPDEETRRDELVFDLIKRRYDSELDRIKTLDNKAGSLIGLVSVVIGLLVGVGTFTILDKLSKSGFSVLFFIGLGFLLLSIIMCLAVIKVRKFKFVPNAMNLKNNYLKSRYRSVIRSNLGTMAKTIDEMEKTNNNKGKLIDWSWYFLVIGLALILIFVIVFTATGTISKPVSINATGKIDSAGNIHLMGTISSLKS